MEVFVGWVSGAERPEPTIALPVVGSGRSAPDTHPMSRSLSYNEGRPAAVVRGRGGPEPCFPDAEREKLDDLRFMLGPVSGSLALALEQLTDAMALVNLHAVYCRVERGPRAGQPPMDVADLLKLLEKVKELVRETMQNLKENG